MSKEAFSYTTPMWGIPLDVALQILQKCGLKLKQFFQVAKDCINLLGWEHVCPSPTFSQVTLSDRITTFYLGRCCAFYLYALRSQIFMCCPINMKKINPVIILPLFLIMLHLISTKHLHNVSIFFFFIMKYTGHENWKHLYSCVFSAAVVFIQSYRSLITSHSSIPLEKHVLITLRATKYQSPQIYL